MVNKSWRDVLSWRVLEPIALVAIAPFEGDCFVRDSDKGNGIFFVKRGMMSHDISLASDSAVFYALQKLGYLTASKTFSSYSNLFDYLEELRKALLESRGLDMSPVTREEADLFMEDARRRGLI